MHPKVQKGPFGVLVFGGEERDQVQTQRQKRAASLIRTGDRRFWKENL